MADDAFNEMVKRTFAELERKNGRVPTIQELADALDIDSRILARKLKRAIATLGTENQIEGTSAFKSTLKELLSGDILFKGWPGQMDLQQLLLDAKSNPQRFSQMRWTNEGIEYSLIINDFPSGFHWVLFRHKQAVFNHVTEDVSEIYSLIESLSSGESVDDRIFINGEPVDYGLPPNLPYQDPIPADQLPSNVFPFRKPYQHSDE